MVGFDPKGEYVIADDAGLDQILVFKLDLTTGKLTPVSKTPSLPGSAPRHFVFDPAGRLFYQLQEQDSMLTVYDFDPASGKLTRGESISALPKGFAGSDLASELLSLGTGGIFIPPTGCTTRSRFSRPTAKVTSNVLARCRLEPIRRAAWRWIPR